MHGFWTGLIGLALACAGAASQAQTGRVADAAISPDGSRLAYIRLLDDEAVLEVHPLDASGSSAVALDLDTLDLPGRFRRIGGDGAWAVEEARAYVGVSFLSGEYLLLSVESNARVIRSGERDVFARSFILRLADWDLEPMAPGAWVAALGIDAPDQIVTVEPDQSWSNPGGGTNLRAMDGYELDHPRLPELSVRHTHRNVSLDGRRVRQARRTPAAYGEPVGFDTLGEADLGLNDVTRTLWIRSDGQSWHRVHPDLGETWEAAGFDPDRGYRKWTVVRATTSGLDYAGDTVTLVELVGEEGLFIRRLDIATGEVSHVLFEGAKVDFDGFLLDWRTSRVIGLRWLGEGGGDWYWADDFSQIAAEIEALRPGVRLEMIDWDQDLSRIIVRLRPDDGGDVFWLYQRGAGALTPIQVD
tara:strand:+ start:11719 stop:12963 length:1245 start_codon:yes stop_codon:yes gene_type:complete